MSEEIEQWSDQIYQLLDAGADLDDIESAAKVTIAAIREERGDE